MNFLKYVHPAKLLVRDSKNTLRKLSAFEIVNIVRYQSDQTYNTRFLKNVDDGPYFCFKNKRYDIFYMGGYNVDGFLE